MQEKNTWQRIGRQQMSRRALLRASARAGIGVAGLALVGCGDDDDSGDESPAAVAQAQPEPAAQAQPEPAAQAQPEPAAQAQPEPAAQAQPEPAAQAQPEPAAQAQAEFPDKITVFTQALVNNQALWLAEHQGFFREEGLNQVDIIAFSSGTTASESFRVGQGDLITTGDLPAINNWFTQEGGVRVVAAMERDALGYGGVARSEITTAQDLIGKKIGTRVGSTGSFLVDIYLQKNGVDPSEVEVINLETQLLVPALDRGDIDAFFIWEPHLTRALEVSGDKVHRLTTAEGYIQGYSVLGARTSWLERYPEAAVAFMRALIRGAEFAQANRAITLEFFEDEHAVDQAASGAQFDLQEVPIALDEAFYNDFCQEFRWAQSVGIREPGEELLSNEWVARAPLIGADPSRAPEPPFTTCPT